MHSELKIGLESNWGGNVMKVYQHAWVGMFGIV